MFDQIPSVPPDPVFSINDEFRADSSDDKVNLTVGVYQDEAGVTPVMKCVKQAETRLLKSEISKGYLGIGGLAAV